MKLSLERETYKAQSKRVDEQRAWLVKMLRELEEHQRGIKTRYETLSMPSFTQNGGQQGNEDDVVHMQAQLFIQVRDTKEKRKKSFIFDTFCFRRRKKNNGLKMKKPS